MSQVVGPECSFLIPLRRDKELSDGKPHPRAVWKWFYDELINRFSGATQTSQTLLGWYTDPDTQALVSDESYEFRIALSHKEVARLRKFLVKACEMFEQKCIYLTVGGIAELVSGPKRGTH